MMTSKFSQVSVSLGVLLVFAAVGCGGSGSTSTAPPVEGIKPAPDAPFGGLGNPYNEDDKKAAAKKKG